jgi:FkbM family methyltransferase
MRFPRTVRRLTDPVLERARIPILSGPNRGRWWNLSSAGSGYVSGRRAAGQLRFLLDLVEPMQVAWDVGAHHGYVALALARRVAAAGRVHAFEPGERNRRLLQQHVDWNGLRQVRVHDCALGRENGTARFGGESTSKTLALGAGTETVHVRTVKWMIESGAAAVPDFLKVDVEDAEADLLEGAADALPLGACMVIAMHSRASDQRCSTVLRDAGFRCYASAGLRTVRGATWNGDPDLCCIGPHVPPERAARIARVAVAAGFLSDN